MKKKGITKLLVPGFIFQSVLIAGGYGTGAEIAEYFGTNGMVGGLLAALVTLVVWSVLCAITFEFARVFKTYDYGSMMKELLGKLGFLYDIIYYLMMFIVLGVVNAAAGSMFAQLTGLNSWIGVGLLAVCSVILIMKGTDTVEKVLEVWSYVLYAVYIMFVIASFMKFSDRIGAEFAKGEIGSGWFSDGLVYAFYNLVCVPVALFTIRDCESRSEAVTSGLLAGVIGIVPGILLLLMFGCDLSAAVAAETPVTVIFENLNITWLYIAFEIVLFGTLIETTTGFIKAVVDRVNAGAERSSIMLPSWADPAIIIGLTVAGVCVSGFGLTNLIAKGYGTACYGFLIFFALPMLFIGVSKISKAGK